MTAPEDDPATTAHGMNRRSLLAAALVGGIAVPLVAWQGIIADTGQIAGPPPQSPPGSINVLDYLDPRQLADVRSGRGSIDVTQALQRALRSGRQVYFPAGDLPGRRRSRTLPQGQATTRRSLSPTGQSSRHAPTRSTCPTCCWWKACAT